VTVDAAVGADVCVGVGVDVGALEDSVRIKLGVCDASARVMCKDTVTTKRDWRKP
jgi:hypothetical protein